MLQVKVRAWHRKNQKMMSPEEVQQEGYLLDPTGKGFLKYDSTGSGQLQFASTMVPLLGSGQKDKNGLEIFEGDIVSHHGRVYQVLWYDTGLWMIGETGKPVDIATSCDQAEVMGDLYTNPDKINA